MTADAQISQVEQLTTYAKQLGDFAESISINTTAFVNLVTEKLFELKEMKKAAEKMQYQIAQQKQRLFHAYAEVAQNGEPEFKKKLLLDLQEAEEKERIANRKVGIIDLQVNVAHGAVMAIIDKNKHFRNEIGIRIEAGRSYINKASLLLEQYKDNQNPL